MIYCYLQMMLQTLFRIKMQHIYAPWRNQYFENKPDSCVFCHISKNEQNDEENFVFYRDEICLGVMNLYPYTPGHLLFIPHSHIDSPESLDLSSWLHIQHLVYQSCQLLYAFGAQGINYGINIKKSAGAGIPEHLHLHVLPRYNGDTNFMSTIVECRVYGSDFLATYQKIKTLAKTYLNPKKED